MHRTPEVTAALENHIRQNDPGRWHRILEIRARSARMAAERDAREAETIRKHARLEEYLATLAPIQAGKARLSLKRSMRWKRVEIQMRFVMIERMVTEGATLDGHRFWLPDGSSFYDASALTSYGIGYAAYLLSLQPAKCVADPP